MKVLLRTSAIMPTSVSMNTVARYKFMRCQKIEFRPSVTRLNVYSMIFKINFLTMTQLDCPHLKELLNR